MENLEPQFLRPTKFERDPSEHERKNELLDKQKGEPLSLEELAELQGLLGKDFSLEVYNLWERIRANDPNVELVEMREGKAIKVKSDQQEKKIIWTYALGGCITSVVFVEQADGTRHAILTHYPPTEISQNLVKLRELISDNLKKKEALAKQTLLLMMPGKWVQDPNKIKSRRRQEGDLLIDAVQEELGTEIDVRIEPYSQQLEFGKKDQGTLLVYIPPFRKGEAKYRTWFNEGTLSKEEVEE